MKANIISIGDELLIGQTVNTNASYIGQKLTEMHIKVNKIITIRDEEEAIKNEFEAGYKESDFIIVTGGLGPTHDDITKRCIVDFFETELIENESTLEDIKKFFAQRDRQVTDLNKKQALIPKIAKALTNNFGTAPGILIEKESRVFVSMPGVPKEMKEMFDNEVVPILEEKIGEVENVIKFKTFSTTGIPESELYRLLEPITSSLTDTSVAFLPNQFGVKLRVTVSGDSDESVQNRLTELEQKVRTLVGRYIYSNRDENIETVVARLLTDRNLTIATAESCTGGLIASRLTNIAGSSKYFNRGVITYSNGAKVELLQVDEDIIDEKGAVSLEVARQMAEGIRKTSGTDIGLSVTGIMGPTVDDSDKPVGLVYVGIADENMVTAKEFRFGNDRLINKDRTSQAALEMLRRNLLGIEYDE